MEKSNLKYYPKVNSLKHTFCIFQEVSLTLVLDQIPDFSSKSGSKYYYSKEGIYRSSNHWGRFANAKWRLIDNGLSVTKEKVGFAKWDDFYPDNADDLLYFIAWNKESNEVNYQHKMLPDYDGKAILRNSSDTQKRLKNARNILNLTNWAKYFDEDITVLREYIITDLIYTNLSLDDIKRKYL